MYFWEAVGGRGRPCPPDWLREIRSHQRANQGSTASHGLPRPPTFGLPRPLIASASHILSCDLSKPIRGARPPTASHFPRCRSASHALRAMLSDPRGRLTDFSAKRIASPARVRWLPRPLTSDSHGLPHGLSLRTLSPRWEAVGGRARPLTTKSCDLSESPKWEAVWEADRPLTHTRPVTPLPAEAMRLAEDWTASAGRGATRPVCVRGRSASHTASHFGLSDRSHDFGRPHRWQIWLSDRSDRLDWS